MGRSDFKGLLDGNVSDLDRVVLELDNSTRHCSKMRVLVHEQVDWSALQPLSEQESDTLNMSILLRDHRAIVVSKNGSTVVRPIGWIAWAIKKEITSEPFKVCMLDRLMVMY